MSDYNSSLPVRTENPGDVIAKLADATIPSQQLAITAAGNIKANTFDGAGTAITSTLLGSKQSLDVNVAGINTGVIDKSSFTYGTSIETPIGGVFQDTSPTLIAGTTGAVRATAFRALHINLRDAAGNQLGDSNADGLWVRPGDGTNVQTYTASGAANVTSSNFPTTVDTNYGVVGANTIRTAAEIGNATGAADFNTGAATAQTLRVTANIQSSAGTAFSETNPLPVFITESSGTSINDYATSAALAAGASVNHDYTVTAGKTLYLTQIEAAGSGKIKMEVQAPSGTSKFVQFNSTANPNCHIQLQEHIAVAAAAVVRVIITNKDNQAQNVYSTISGHEV